ncbi:hypothetical protein STRIP9103_01046 [Streptomyces ipomoeae 91-03]|uniref:Uncharacterized protein n=1 Tax=Streptomyces ipomoeae 91-03 TaxID=698759 RepID=L1KQU0_9ACTN|nr:hypothetical protein STRIP9103_01046 [Streptomyces ipomoeae 91-03]
MLGRRDPGTGARSTQGRKQPPCRFVTHGRTLVPQDSSPANGTVIASGPTSTAAIFGSPFGGGCDARSDDIPGTAFGEANAHARVRTDRGPDLSCDRRARHRPHRPTHRRPP